MLIYERSCIFDERDQRLPTLMHGIQSTAATDDDEAMLQLYRDNFEEHLKSVCTDAAVADGLIATIRKV